MQALTNTQKFPWPGSGKWYEMRLHHLLDDIGSDHIKVVGFQTMFGVGFNLWVQDEVQDLVKFYHTKKHAMDWVKYQTGVPEVAVTLHKVETPDGYRVADAVFSRYHPSIDEFN